LCGLGIVAGSAGPDCAGRLSRYQRSLEANHNCAGPNNTVLPMGSHLIEPANWSFECIDWSDDCGWNGRGFLPSRSRGPCACGSQELNGACLALAINSYDWAYSDTWLDLIAQPQPTVVMYTFGLAGSPPLVAMAKVGVAGTIIRRARQATLPLAAALRLMPWLRRWCNIAHLPGHCVNKVLGDVERGQSYSFLDRHRNAVV
jgi:hypothetical protein